MRGTALAQCAGWLMALALLLVSGAPAADDRAEDALIRASGFNPETIGYMVYDLDAQHVVRAWRADETFIPASVTKILTGIGALEALGPDRRFSTYLATDRPRNGEALDGDLYLVGGGDPLLVEKDLRSLADALAAETTGKVAGEFYFDSSALPFFPEISSEQIESVAYNTAVSALSVDFNRQLLHWRRNEATRALQVAIRPDLGLSTAGLATAPMDDGRSVALALSDRAPPRWLLTPRVPSAGSLWVPVREPDLQAATLFRLMALERDVALDRPEPGRIHGHHVLLAEHLGPPVDEIVVQALRFSNNMVSELLGLQATKRLGVEVQGLDESARTLFIWLRSAMPDGGWESFRPENHSGLSTASRATPRQLVAMLLYGAYRTYGDADFLALLPNARWLTGQEPYAVRAKTGTMHYASGLAGIVEHRQGRRLLFAVFNTDYEGRAALEADPRRYQSDVQQRARAWTSRARQLEERLVRHWADAIGSGKL